MEQISDMDFKEMLTGLFNTDFLTPEELETICKAGEMYAAAKIRNLDKAITEEAAKEIIANQLYNISNHSGHHLLDTMKCDEIAEFILHDLRQYILQRVDSEAVGFAEWLINESYVSPELINDNEGQPKTSIKNLYQEYKNSLTPKS